MNRGQYQDASSNYPGSKRLWFKWTMTSATAFTINRASEFLAGTSAIVRTGAGVFDLFPEQPPGAGLLGWWTGSILATVGSLTVGGSGQTSIANNLTASNKVTVTFRRADTLAAADLATGDVVHGYLDIMTVVI